MEEETRTPIAPHDALRQLIARLGPAVSEADRYRWVFPCNTAPDGLLMVTAALTSDGSAAYVALTNTCSRNLPAEVKIVVRTWEMLRHIIRAVKERETPADDLEPVVRPAPESRSPQQSKRI